MKTKNLLWVGALHAKANHLFSFYFLLLLSFCIISNGCSKTDYAADVKIFSPKVVGVTPADEATGIALGDTVSVFFNKDMDSTTINAKSVLLLKDSVSVPGTVCYTNKSAHFISSSELEPNTNYTVRVLATVCDGNKNSLANEYEWRFTTKGPDHYTMTKRTDQVTDFIRDGSRCMQMGNYLYSYGGWTDNGGEVTYNDVYRSKDDLTEWVKQQNAPWFPRHVFGCVKKDGKVWVMGGDNLNSNFDVWNSADGLQWTKIGATNPEPVGQRLYSGFAMHKIGNTEWLYLVGGLHQKDVLRSADGITWQVVASNVSALTSVNFPGGEGFSSSLASMNGQLYLICGGGNISEGPPRKTIFKSSDNGVTWQQMPNFPGYARRYTDVIVFDQKIWVIGGYNDYTIGNLKDIWYMKKDGSWTEFHTPAEYIGRHASGVGVYNNKLVITCGNYNNDCWVIEKDK